MKEDKTLNEIIRILSVSAHRVRELETQANKALYEENDPSAHRGFMVEKAELLASLPELVESHIPGLRPGLREEVQERIQKFSQSAETALGLESVFFMTALLYPEDYREGEKNDLESFIAHLSEKTS